MEDWEGGLGAEGQLTAQPLPGPEGSPPGGLPGGGEWGSDAGQTWEGEKVALNSRFIRQTASLTTQTKVTPDQADPGRL